MMDMVNLKGLYHELLMNSFSNRAVLLLSEGTSSALHSFLHHGISNSLSPVILYFLNKQEEKIEILILAFVKSFLFGAEKKKGFVTQS